MSSPRVLTLASVFPNPVEPGLGLFVRARLQAAARDADWKVVAPVPVADYSQGPRRLFSAWRVPRRRTDGALEVLHPRWWYPPGGGAINGFLLFLQLAAPLARLRRRFPFEVIDAHFGHPDGVAAALLAGLFRCPYAVTLRGNETMHGRRALRRMAMTRALRGAALVVAVSESLRGYALELGVRPERVRLIPNGVDTQIYFPRDRAECRRKHGIPLAAQVVLSAGSLIERKGHHRVVEALCNPPGGTATLLLVAGGPGREGRFRGQIADAVQRCRMESCVRLLGHVDPGTLAELMSAADVLCLASDREGWPNVVHEAMACGVPVVATAVGAVPEMIAPGCRGLVVPAGDPAALRRALLEALARPWDREAIRRWAHARSWAEVGRQVREELGRLASCGTRDRQCAPDSL